MKVHSKKDTKINTGKDGIDLEACPYDDDGNIIELDEKRNEKFWESIEALINGGVPPYDKNGHSTEIRIRMRPLQRDIFASIVDQFEDGFFKSQSAFYRIVIAVGCKTLLGYLKRSKGADITKIEHMLILINLIGKKIRMEEFIDDAKKLRQQTVDRSSDSWLKDVKVLDDMINNIADLYKI